MITNTPGTWWVSSYGTTEAVAGKLVGLRGSLPQRLESDTGKKRFIAAVNRCATQRQGQGRVFSKL
jgi:hypothetical protein